MRLHRHRHGHRRHGHHHRHWGPWDSGGRFFGQGEIRLALLSLLSGQPMHGYEIMRQLEERLEGAYKASPGAIYPTLQQLEDEDLIVPVKEADKKVYRLTPEGEREVTAHQEDIDSLWIRAKEWCQWDLSNEPAMTVLAEPMRKLMQSVKRTLRKTHDAAMILQVEQIISKAQAEIDKARTGRR